MSEQISQQDSGCRRAEPQHAGPQMYNQPHGCDVRHQIKTTKFLPKITVDGAALSEDELAREIQYHPAASFQEALKSAAQALIIRRLLAKEAAAEGLSHLDEESAFAALIERHSAVQAVSDNDCRRYYAQNLPQFTSAPLMVVRHILLAADKDDFETRAVQKKLAERLLSEIKAAPDCHQAFIERTRFSRCPSKKDAGMLGEIGPGQTMPEFERQIFTLHEGLAERPIETRYGYHLVYIEHKENGRQIPYDFALPRIKDYLQSRRERQAAADYLYTLTAKAHIEGIELRPNEKNIIFAG